MSKSNKKEVGKGIRALLANIDKTPKTSSKKGTKIIHDVEENLISVDLIEPNPFQPRKSFNEEELAELVQSIKIHGIIQPIAVRQLNAKSYQIISGERRWRASKVANLKKVPVHIIKADDQAMLEIALLENIQRADLNPIEISLSLERLISECDLTHDEVAERIGKKRSSVSNYLRLLKLSPSVQDALRQGNISMGHAKVLGGIERIEQQTFLLGIVLKDGLSVRATEKLMEQHKGGGNTTTKSQKRINPEVESIKKRLSEIVGSPIHINRSNSGKGYIRINFGSDDELNDIVETILD